jgi:hypothetical protein
MTDLCRRKKRKKAQCKQKRKIHISARKAPVSASTIQAVAATLHKGDIQGSSHLFGLRLVGCISDRCNLDRAVQAATIFLGSRPALLLLNHKVGSKMHEHEKRMLFPTVSFPVTELNAFKDSPERNTQSPDCLGLETVESGGASPSIQSDTAALLDILH